MQNLKYFSGIKPTVEDVEFDQTGKSNAILQRQSEMFSDGVVEGLGLIRFEGNFVLTAGSAYVQGERIHIPENRVVTIENTDEPRFVFVKFRVELSQPVRHFVTGEIFNIYQCDSFEILVKDNDTAEEFELLIADVRGTDIIDRRTFIRLNVDDRLHAPNNDIGTTAEEFRVGMGSPAHPMGIPVMLESAAPKPPLNVRITSIEPDSVPWSQSPSVTIPSHSHNLGPSSGMARVFFAWNYTDIIGESIASNIFRIDNADYIFTEDELKDYYLTFASGEEFRISGNQASANVHTLITVEEDLRNLEALSHPATIHPGATDYRFTIIPVEVEPQTPIVTNPAQNPGPIYSLPIVTTQRVEGMVSFTASPAASNCMIRLPLGGFYIFQVSAGRKNYYSLPAVMGAGSFHWNGQTINYTYPFLVALPNIGAGTVSLQPLLNGSGFMAQIGGQEEVDLFEYGWCNIDNIQGNTIDFDNPEHHPGVSRIPRMVIYTMDDFLQVVAAPDYASQLNNVGLGGAGGNPQPPLTPIENSYLFSVRPLIGGQVVGEAVSAQITLEIDRNMGQTPIINAIQALSAYCDALNMTIRNIDVIRQAQAGMIEGQLETLNVTLPESQQYERFSMQNNVTLPYPNVSNLPDLGGVRTSPLNTIRFNLDPELLEQTFTHNLGHTNYFVQLRDIEDKIVETEIELNEHNIVVSLSQPMSGSVLIMW